MRSRSRSSLSSAKACPRFELRRLLNGRSTKIQLTSRGARMSRNTCNCDCTDRLDFATSRGARVSDVHVNSFLRHRAKDLMGERRELSARLTEMKRERWQTTSQSDMQELDRRRCRKLELAYTNIDQIGDSLLACSRLSCLQDMARKRTVETLTRVSSSVNGLNPCQAVPDISQLGPCVSAEVLRGRAFLLSTDKQRSRDSISDFFTVNRSDLTGQQEQCEVHDREPRA